MVRLNIETLDGRDLLSAGVLAGTMSALPEPRTALLTELEEFAGTTVSLTAPLGSTMGSLIPADGFTPPIGSNKGSLTAEFAGDGLGSAHALLEYGVPYTYAEPWATRPTSFAGDAYLNEMGVVGTNRDVNGIIAILIGLRTPTGPAAGGAAQPLPLLPYLEQENLFKQY